jgi:hypothetical protein
MNPWPAITFFHRAQRHAYDTFPFAPITFVPLCLCVKPLRFSVSGAAKIVGSAGKDMRSENPEIRRKALIYPEKGNRRAAKPI